jgi:CRP-like cAMP-binding protein
MPVSPPVLRPSLIPLDVAQAAAKASQEIEHQEQAFFGEDISGVITAPSSHDSFPVVTRNPANPAYASGLLRQTPLFSLATTAALSTLAGQSNIANVPAGEKVFVQGESATCFYVVIAGTLEVTADKEGIPVVLRQARQHEVFGMYSILSDQPRTATVRALEDTTLLEIPAASLDRVIQDDPDIRAAVAQTQRERTLETFLSQRIFAQVDSVAKARLIGKFTTLELRTGETLMQPGEVANALIVLSKGELRFEGTPKPNQPAKQLTMSQGQFVAVTCAMSGVPAQFRMFASLPTALEVLKHKDLNEVIRDFPSLRNLPGVLAKHTKTLDRDVYCGNVGTQF